MSRHDDQRIKSPCKIYKESPSGNSSRYNSLMILSPSSQPTYGRLGRRPLLQETLDQISENPKPAGQRCTLPLYTKLFPTPLVHTSCNTSMPQFPKFSKP